MMNSEIFTAYRPPDRSLWRGRSDDGHERFYGHVNCIDLSGDQQLPERSIALVGFASDSGVRRNEGHTGAILGPTALRQALGRLPYPCRGTPFCDLGNITCNHEHELAASQSALGMLIAHLHTCGALPIAIGGGHEIAWAHYQGIKRAYPHKQIALVNIDAHFDLRTPPSDGIGTSGSSFWQIAEEDPTNFRYLCLGIQPSGNTPELFDRAASLNVNYVTAAAIHNKGIAPALEQLEEILLQSDAIYCTLCMDVFAAPFAPGVSAPQPLGLLPWHVVPLIERLAASGKVAGFDIAELCPPRDREGTTANLAAAMIYHYLAAVSSICMAE
jgi:formiminoglutamase